LEFMVTASADIGTNGRLVVPKKIREEMGIKEGDTLFFEVVSDAEFIVRVVKGEDEFLQVIRSPPEGRAMDPGKLKEELWG